MDRAQAQLGIGTPTGTGNKSILNVKKIRSVRKRSPKKGVKSEAPPLHTSRLG